KRLWIGRTSRSTTPPARLSTLAIWGGRGRGPRRRNWCLSRRCLEQAFHRSEGDAARLTRGFTSWANAWVNRAMLPLLLLPPDPHPHYLDEQTALRRAMRGLMSLTQAHS